MQKTKKALIESLTEAMWAAHNDFYEHEGNYKYNLPMIGFNTKDETFFYDSEDLLQLENIIRFSHPVDLNCQNVSQYFHAQIFAEYYINKLWE